MEKAWLYGSWYGHQKSLGLPLSAKGMWLDCFAWSIAQDTEGFIPTKVVRSVAGWGEGTEGRNLADLLVDAGLWEEVAGGYQMHNWCDRQPAADAILRRREQTRDRMRRLRDRQHVDGPEATQEVTDHVTRHSDAGDAPRGEEKRKEPSASGSADTGSAGGGENGFSGQSPNGRTKGGTPRKVSPACQALTRELWEALDPKPLCRFVGLQAMLAECLGAGYTEHALRAVAPHVVAWSRNGIAMAMHMAKIDPKAGAPAKRYFTDPADYGL